MPEFRRLTYKTPDGAWGIEGVSLLSCPARLYGVAAKLCGMESLCEDVCRAKDAELTLDALQELVDKGLGGSFIDLRKALKGGGAMTANRVLVVRVPAGWARAEDLPDLAEYVGNAIVDGVLVLGESVRLELMELPPLGAVEVVAEPVPSLGTAKLKAELPDILPAEGVSRPEPKPPEPPPERPPAEKPKPAEPVSLRLPIQPKEAPKPVSETEPVFVGVGAIEKRRIHERLTRYWQTAGPGAMQRLADKIGWPVANVYGAQRAERFDRDHWRQLDRGMDALGFEMEGEK